MLLSRAILGIKLSHLVLKDYHVQHGEMFHFHVNVDVVVVNSHRDTRTGDDADKGNKIRKLYL